MAVLDGVPHGFFGRPDCGLGSSTDRAVAEENRRRAADMVIAGAPIASAYQIHSPTAVVVTEPTAAEDRPRCDALVTATPGLLLGIVTADCAPVLLADRKAGVVAAAHAGWRGATAGVTDQAVAAMIGLGARIERIVAAVGPCIARVSYEVDDGFAARLTDGDPDSERFFSEGPAGKPHFDLEAYVVARLAAAGIRRIEASGRDTYALEQDYFSYRRATHRGEADYGRQLSLIGLPPR